MQDEITYAHLPSRASVDILFQSVRLVMDTCMHSDDLSSTRRVLTQCGVVFAYFIWHTRAAAPGDEPVECIRELLDTIDFQLARRMVHTLGVEHPGMGCVNAALWARLPPSSRETPDLCVQTRECCRCNKRAPETCNYSPFLWRECDIEAPICETCADSLELHIPLYAQPTARWCTACGRPADGELSAAGNGCFICRRCELLVKRDG